MTDRKRRSEQLTKEELAAFKKLLRSYPTKTDAQDAIGVSRQVLDLVSIKGSGSPETIEKVRKAIGEAA